MSVGAAATWGACVTATTWARRARRARRTPIASATAPPTRYRPRRRPDGLRPHRMWGSRSPPRPCRSLLERSWRASRLSDLTEVVCDRQSMRSIPSGLRRGRYRGRRSGGRRVGVASHVLPAVPRCGGDARPQVAARADRHLLITRMRSTRASAWRPGCRSGGRQAREEIARISRRRDYRRGSRRRERLIKRRSDVRSRSRCKCVKFLRRIMPRRSEQSSLVIDV